MSASIALRDVPKQVDDKIRISVKKDAMNQPILCLAKNDEVFAIELSALREHIPNFQDIFRSGNNYILDRGQNSQSPIRQETAHTLLEIVQELAAQSPIENAVHKQWGRISENFGAAVKSSNSWLNSTALPYVKASYTYFKALPKQDKINLTGKTINAAMAIASLAYATPDAPISHDVETGASVVRIDLADIATTSTDDVNVVEQTTTQYWEGLNLTDAQIARTNLDYSLKSITDPEMRIIINDYTNTQYFQDAFTNPNHVETGRLWMIPAAAGIQELWDNSEHREFLQRTSFDTAEKALTTLILFSEIESYFGQDLGNDNNKRVGGIWHLEDKTLISIATQYFSADELGLNQDGDAEAWEAFKTYADRHEGQLMRRGSNGDRAFTNAGVPQGMQGMRDRVLQNGRYGRVTAKLVLMLHADNVKRSIASTSLTADSFRNNPHLLYGMHVLGLPRFNAMIRQGGNSRLANFSRWRGVRNQNPSLVCRSGTGTDCVARTKNELLQEFNNRFQALPVQRLQSTTSSNIRTAVGWDFSPHIQYLRP